MFAGAFLLLKKSTRMASDTLLFSSATPCSVNFVETKWFQRVCCPGNSTNSKTNFVEYHCM